MERRITATELARRLGDVLGRIRYRRDSFVVERNGVPVARLLPLGDSEPVTVREALSSWRGAGGPDLDFAKALERVGDADRSPGNPWASS
jgi:antitoxin (DNA-binding transcriptional repressor) of toxin-antitoxin stability system